MDEGLQMHEDLIREVGLGVEAALEKEFAIAMSAEGVPTDAPEEHVRSLGKVDPTPKAMEFRNAAHAQAVRDRLQHGPQRFSFATDGARIGFKQRQNTAWVFEDNFAVWGAPVVTIA